MQEVVSVEGVLIKRIMTAITFFLRFLIVGGGANLLVLGIYYFSTLIIELHHMLSLFTASAIGFWISYLTNRIWTFRFKGEGDLFRFAVSYVASLGSQGVMLWIGVDIFGFRHEWVVPVGLAVVTCFSFLLQRFWVFRSQSASSLTRAE